MAATLTAARACASTVLFHNLRVHAFRGAVPHVVLVVDAQPGVLQKVLVEGYVQVLNEYNAHGRPPPQPDVNRLVLPRHRVASSRADAQQQQQCDGGNDKDDDDDGDAAGTRDVATSFARNLFMSLRPMTRAPSGAAGLTHTSTTTTATAAGDDDANAAAYCAPCISYAIMPFDAATFMHDVQQLQAFLRQCGSGSTSDTDAVTTTMTTETTASSSCAHARFCDAFARVYAHVRPLSTRAARDGADGGDADDVDGAVARALCASLWHGPLRELLGVVLIQRSAFQNEMRRYRLRLGLFDMGMRVAEHCHLESMSAPADACVAAAYESSNSNNSHNNSSVAADHDEAATAAAAAALCDDQVFTYARSCALPPAVVETLAKAIADAIDVQAWQRDATSSSSSSAAAATVCENEAAAMCVRAPPSFAAAQANEAVWAMFRRGALTWTHSSILGGNRGSSGNSAHAQHNTVEDEDEDDEAVFRRTLRLPVTGPGAPLRIVCRDADKVLTFSGGMEDCLMNTGYYAAADDAQRNDVHTHRTLFALARSATTTATAEASGDGSSNNNSSSSKAVAASGDEVAPRHGRLKKQDYLALRRRQRDEQQQRQQHGGGGDKDDDEDEAKATVAAMAEGVTSRAGALAAAGGGIRGACMSSSIGGTFPIGEVISESFDLSALHGVCDVFAYPDPLKSVAMCKPRPFTMTIDRGVVVDVGDNAPDEFVELLDMVREAEGACYVRELGIGLNPYVGLAHVLQDVTSFERQWGVHLSLGQRHPLFVKQRVKRNADGGVATGVRVVGPVLKRKAGKYHIDVFVDAAAITMGALRLDFTHGVAVT